MRHSFLSRCTATTGPARPAYERRVCVPLPALADPPRGQRNSKICRPSAWAFLVLAQTLRVNRRYTLTKMPRISCTRRYDPNLETRNALFSPRSGSRAEKHEVHTKDSPKNCGRAQQSCVAALEGGGFLSLFCHSSPSMVPVFSVLRKGRRNARWTTQEGDFFPQCARFEGFGKKRSSSRQIRPWRRSRVWLPLGLRQCYNL